MSVSTRLLIAVGLLLAVGFGATEYATQHEVRDQAEAHLRVQARRITSVLMATRRVYHHQFMASGIELTPKTVGFLPAAAISRISAELDEWDHSGFRFNNVSDRPRNRRQRADSLELAAMDYFRANPQELVHEASYIAPDGKDFVLYTRPIWTEKYCLKCHGKREDAPPTIRDTYEHGYDYEVGDLRGLLSIRVPASVIAESTSAHMSHVLPPQLGIFVALLGVIFVLVGRYVRFPLGQLAAAMKDLEAGRDADLPELAGELRQVGDAFVAMRATIHRQQQELGDSESKYRRVVEDSRDAIFIGDPELKLLEGNAALCALTGYSRAELVGMPVKVLCADPAQLEEIREALDDFGSVQSLEMVLRRNGGSERIVMLSATAQLTDDGEQLALVHGIVHDITEARQAQAECARLATVIEQGGEAVLVTDPKGEIVYVNPAFEKLTGYTRSEVHGAPVDLLRSGRHSREFYQQMWYQLRGGQAWQGRVSNRRKAAQPEGEPDAGTDPLLYEADVTISPMRDASDRIVNFVAVMRDVTEEASLQEQLRHAQKMEAVGRLAGGVAHDFNNMLTAILTTVQAMLLDLPVSDPKRDGLVDVREAAQHAAGLTRRLLTFGRRQVADPVVIDLHDQLQDLAKMLRRLIGEDIELLVEVALGTHAIRADVGQLEQVITNLVVNARDAMPVGGQICIRARNAKPDDVGIPASMAEQDAIVILSVSDTGCGISEGLRERVFDPFFTTKEVGRGTGLGLSIVYGIVGQAGGAVALTSTVGEGTTLRLYFPAVVDELPQAEEVTGPVKALPARGQTILLAEDEPLVRRVTEGILLSAGYQVLVACDGQEALHLLDSHSTEIDLAVLDVVMPKASGRVVYEHIQRGAAKLPVLFVSGYNDGETHSNFVAEQGLNFLCKPFDAKRLLEAVSKVLARSTEEAPTPPS